MKEGEEETPPNEERGRKHQSPKEEKAPPRQKGRGEKAPPSTIVVEESTATQPERGKGEYQPKGEGSTAPNREVGGRHHHPKGGKEAPGHRWVAVPQPIKGTCEVNKSSERETEQ